MLKLPLDEIRLTKLNSGYPHASIYAEGRYEGTRVAAAAMGLYPTPLRACAATLRHLFDLAVLIGPDAPVTALGNVKTVVD